MRKTKNKPYISDEEMLDVWRGAWEEGDGKNPYSLKINKAMLEHGFGIHDLKTRLGVILGTERTKRTEDEVALLDFDKMARECAESALIDQCGSSVNGAIFLLESKYGYRKGTDINITAEKDVVKKVVRWGDEEEPSIGIEGSGMEAANG